MFFSFQQSIHPRLERVKVGLSVAQPLHRGHVTPLEAVQAEAARGHRHLLHTGVNIWKMFGMSIVNL